MFLVDLYIVFFGVMDIFDDLDDKFFVFEIFFMEVFDEYVLLKEFYVWGN